MNLNVINDCAGTELGLPTSGTDPGRRYIVDTIITMNITVILTLKVTNMFTVRRPLKVLRTLTAYKADNIEWYFATIKIGNKKVALRLEWHPTFQRSK